MPAEGVCADLSPSSSGHPGLPFPPLSAPGRAAGARDGEGDPCRRRGRGSRGRLPTPTPRAPCRRHSPERPHWRRVGGPGRAAGAPGAHLSASCGERGSDLARSPDPLSSPPRPIPPVPTRTFRPPTSGAAAPGPGPSLPPASPSRLGRRLLDLGPTAVVPSAKVWVSPPVLTHRPQYTGRLVGGASGRRGCWEV